MGSAKLWRRLSDADKLLYRLLRLRSDPWALGGLGLAARRRQIELARMKARLELLEAAKSEAFDEAWVEASSFGHKVSELSAFHGAELAVRAALIKVLAGRNPRPGLAA